jgi:GNAT superfamily N-acetyltransferase
MSEEAWGSPYLAAQAAYLRHLGTAPSAEVSERGGVYSVRTRVRSNGENAAVSGVASRVTRATAKALAGWFAEWGVPASWLCAEGAGRVRAAAALEATGYRPERSGWEMRARLDRLELRTATGGADTRIQYVTSARRLDAWLDVAGACGWFEGERSDREDARRALRELHAGLGFARSAPLRHYLALRGDTAVGMASAFFTDGAVALASVAVLPSARRQGIGQALALARLREARARGCEFAVLAPSPDGEKLYLTLGFESHPQPPDRWFYAPLLRDS